jgi:phthiocerol/phenolphthiocerol synthesis type-I polyketide synthase E
MSVDELNSGIAIIGMAGRFPGSRDVEELWRHLIDGTECLSFFSEAEMLAAGVDAALLGDPRYVKASGFLEDADRFDAGFFGMTPREAEITDPQQRLFLECSWEALEDAGYDSAAYPNLVGVFGGASFGRYLLHLLGDARLFERIGSFRLQMGNDRDFLTTWASYRLGLQGPSVNVQSACSTSLVAVHLACQSLLGYECDMALAGGVSVRNPRKSGYLYEEGGVTSADGHCRAFDAAATGTVSGDGAGIVVLRRLVDALADGDRIQAVIRGSAINNDGARKPGFAVPGVDGQARVVAEALAVAGVDPEQIRYVEAHGTGTPVGDPIEIAALCQAEDEYRASGCRSRRGGPDQDRAGRGEPDPAAQPALHRAQSSDRFRRHPLLRGRPRRESGGGGDRLRRCELLRHRRYQRPSGVGLPAAAAAARGRGGLASASAVGAHCRGSRPSDGAPRPASEKAP